MAAAHEAFAPFFQVWKASAAAANKVREAYVAATKGHGEAVANVLATSEDEVITQWRDFDEKIAAKITELTEKREAAKATATKRATEIVPGANPEDVAKMREEYLEHRKAANQVRETVKTLLHGDDAALNAGIEAHGIVEVIGLSGAKNASTGATGIIRKKIASATVDGKPVADSKGKVTFTSLATALKVNGEDLRSAAAKAADVETVKDIPNGTSVTFTIASGDKTHTVVITTPDDSDENASEDVSEGEVSEETASE